MNKIDRQTMIDHCKREVARGSIYVWGAQGERGSKITPAWIKSRETSTTNASRAIYKWEANKKKYDPSMIGAFDCSGLIAACLNANGNPGWDNTADGMYRMCTKIQKSQLQPGDFVFEWTTSKNKSNHIGVYIGNGKVIEAKGRDDGVCMTDLNKRNWVKYGRPDFCYKSGSVAPQAAPSPAPSQTASKGSVTLPDTTLYYRVVTTTQTPLRRSEDPTGALVQNLPANTALRYRGEKGDCYYVSIDNGLGILGYVKASDVKASYLPNVSGVKAVQTVLGLSTDGLYGRNTAKAVAEFQRKHLLVCDSIYGPSTRKKMEGLMG